MITVSNSRATQSSAGSVFIISCYHDTYPEPGSLHSLRVISGNFSTVVARVSDPVGGFPDPDSTPDKKPDPDLIFEKTPDPDPTNIPLSGI